MRVPVHAAGMAKRGFDVVGVDVDAAKVATLQRGEAPFHEPGLQPLVRKHVETGRLRFTTDLAAIADADVHFVCVGTPQSRRSDAADLTYVDDAVARLAVHARPDSLVVGRSTVPVGRRPGWPRSSVTSSWRGTRSSCARATPSRTPCTPTASSWVSGPRAVRRCCGRCTPRRPPPARPWW